MGECHHGQTNGSPLTSKKKQIPGLCQEAGYLYVSCFVYSLNIPGQFLLRTVGVGRQCPPKVWASNAHRRCGQAVPTTQSFPVFLRVNGHCLPILRSVVKFLVFSVDSCLPYVPSCHEFRYASCSGVSTAISMLIACSFNSAIAGQCSPARRRRWVAGRARGLGRPPTRDLDVVQTVRILAPLALWMHEENPGVGLVKKETLRRHLESVFAEQGVENPESAVRRFLADVRESTIFGTRAARAASRAFPSTSVTGFAWPSPWSVLSPDLWFLDVDLLQVFFVRVGLKVMLTLLTSP